MEPLSTSTPQNPFQVDPGWPFQGIAHVFIRCSRSGPTPQMRDCHGSSTKVPTSTNWSRQFPTLAGEGI